MRRQGAGDIANVSSQCVVSVSAKCLTQASGALYRYSFERMGFNERLNCSDAGSIVSIDPKTISRAHHVKLKSRCFPQPWDAHDEEQIVINHH